MVSVLSLLAFAYAIIGDKGYLELRRVDERNLELTRQTEQLRQENREILDEIKALKTDPKLIEAIARQELGMVRPGEIKITTSPAAGSENGKASEPAKDRPKF
jgi:cell division protein FtsB